ncbi:serine/arginine repetitive matrix protein 1-like [Pollicipes pollicipes]|uniref:serine/arginine repetitive matrix protein 1-like n=1 Tax=Pollicipes pollicipes TaxID=41117 RepID=UPI001884BC2F|nr:serine/arginine repetitive matrix protein 1-like [Pollicipes pollicipes]
MLSDRSKTADSPIVLTGQTTLGCSICKGPAGWPGVFVQSIKEVGLAREVGLRPGDQIIQCNGVSFVDIDFAKAVYVLKLAQHLDLTIRRGVAAELFSSGYNSTTCSGTDSSSSSSGTAGSCSPHTDTSGGDRRRLGPTSGGGSRHESPRPPPSSDERHLERSLSPIGGDLGAVGHGASIGQHRRPPVSGDRTNSDFPSRAPESSTELQRSAAADPTPGDPTPGHLTIDRHRRWHEIEAEWAESELAPVGVAGAVTRLQIGVRPSGPPPPPPPAPPATLRGQGDGSSEELDQPDRSTPQQEGQCPPPPPMMSTSTLVPTCRRPLPQASDGVTTVDEPRGKQQHDQLMEEFKQAHKRMFAHKETDEPASARILRERHGAGPPVRHASPPTNGLKRSRPVSGGRAAPEPGRLISHAEKEVIIESSAASRQQRQEQRPPPPPPPPPPEEEKKVNGINIYTTPTLTKLAQTRQLPKAAPAKSAAAATNGRPARGEAGVETESLDSFTLEHPASAAPKPPPTYFDGAPRKRDVLVSIGAYGDNRPAPARLQFLSPVRRTDADESDGKFERVSTQLQHELVQTLSRANLRHRTGSVDNLLADSGAAQRTVTDKYGSVLNIHDCSAENGHGGGILKNGTTRASNKSISFGKTTMIGDVPVTVL